jgi:tRNA dimethylallyltransferase
VNPRRPPAICLAGPTAVGKSDVALELALLLDAEIVSVDSMQVYRGLDLGTAKPSPADRARVLHHLIDVVDLDRGFDAAQFRDQANAAVRDIRARGRRPILCGGTGLYFRALFNGLDASPPPDPILRAQLEARSLPDLLNELAVRDPAAPTHIDRLNLRRVRRALEIVILTGQPLRAQPLTEPAAPPTSGVQRTPSDPEWADARCVVLARPAAELRGRIESRVEAMFANGLVAETAALLDRGLEANRTAAQALGYRQVIDHLRGQHTLPDTIALVKRKTWQFARRQNTWFRHQFPGLWLTLTPDDPQSAVACQLARDCT